MMKGNASRRLVLSAILVAAGVILPQVLRAKGLSDKVFLPMQFPVALAGFLLPMNWAVGCAVAIPALNSALYAAPFLTLDLPLWGCQMIALAAFANFYYDMLGKNVFVSILCAEMLSYVVYFCAASIFRAVSPGGASAVDHFRYAIATGWPGILLQILIVPPLTLLSEKAAERGSP